MICNRYWEAKSLCILILILNLTKLPLFWTNLSIYYRTVYKRFYFDKNYIFVDVLIQSWRRNKILVKRNIYGSINFNCPNSYFWLKLLFLFLFFGKLLHLFFVNIRESVTKRRSFETFRSEPFLLIYYLQLLLFFLVFLYSASRHSSFNLSIICIWNSVVRLRNRSW